MLTGCLSQVSPFDLTTLTLPCRCNIWYQARVCSVFKHYFKSRDPFKESLNSDWQVSGLFLFQPWSQRGCRNPQLWDWTHSSCSISCTCTWYCTSHTVLSIKTVLHALELCRHKSTFLLKVPTLLWAAFFISASVHAANYVLCTLYSVATLVA